MSTLWHPAAKRVIIPGVQDITFKGGGKKVTWHTTEGRTVEGAEATYRQTKSIPHFTIGVKDNRRVLHQHLPLNRAATTLRHPSGTPETNRANNWQVEIAGLARESGQWGSRMYHYLYLLAKWLHEAVGVPMTEDVSWRNPVRLSGQQFYDYKGHIGHMHVPYNDHTDPGRGFHIGYVLNDV